MAENFHLVEVWFNYINYCLNFVPHRSMCTWQSEKYDDFTCMWVGRKDNKWMVLVYFSMINFFNGSWRWCHCQLVYFNFWRSRVRDWHLESHLMEWESSKNLIVTLKHTHGAPLLHLTILHEFSALELARRHIVECRVQTCLEWDKLISIVMKTTWPSLHCLISKQ